MNRKEWMQKHKMRSMKEREFKVAQKDRYEFCERCNEYVNVTGRWVAADVIHIQCAKCNLPGIKIFGRAYLITDTTFFEFREAMETLGCIPALKLFLKKKPAKNAELMPIMFHYRGLFNYITNRKRGL